MSARPDMVRPDGRIDTREAITMWGLLIWAYQRQMVRFAGTGGALAPAAMADCSNAGHVADALALGLAGSGSGGVACGRPSAHADADSVHDLVERLERAEFWAVVRAAETGEMPPWRADFPRLKVVPVLGKHGRPRMYVCPVERRPTACLIEVVGMSDAEIATTVAARRERYGEVVGLMRALMAVLVAEDRLQRWRIVDLGVDDRPWDMSGVGDVVHTRAAA